MQSNLIQQQYDEVIADHYDQDPHEVTGGSLQRAVAMIHRQIKPTEPYKVYDVGMGTGRFMEMLRNETGWSIQPYGLDLSQKMIDVAHTRLADLQAVVGDARYLDDHFPDEKFDLISTHYITGFVPIDVIAQKTWSRLSEGGCWSLVGGTKQGFPALQAKANSKVLKWLFGGKSMEIDDVVCNPADRAEILLALEKAGFQILEVETFEPTFKLANFNEFLDFAYYGGWLTPFIEKLGLHEAKPFVRMMLNTLVFPIEDHHSIEIVLAQK